MTVYLVGAGPGDPDLLTVKASRLLASADVVVHDRLADPAIVRLARPEAELIDVGKRPGSPLPQATINALLVHLGSGAGEHRVIVRLKGGDPFVFGRGGEEAMALLEAGVPFEVVPGVTSAVAAPACAGVPVTHRGLAAAVTVVTGHRRVGAEADTDWESLARVGGTVVILMGVEQRGFIAERLQAGGLSADTPVCAVMNGSRPGQRVIRTSLGRLGQTSIEPPATIVVGAVAGLELLPLTAGQRPEAVERGTAAGELGSP
jgi:uroporphyrin-III C-methyltransferase